MIWKKVIHKEEEEKKEKKRSKRSQSPTNSSKLYKAIPVPVYTPFVQQPTTPVNQFSFPPTSTTLLSSSLTSPNQYQQNSLTNPLATTGPYYFKSF